MHLKNACASSQVNIASVHREFGRPGMRKVGIFAKRAHREQGCGCLSACKHGWERSVPSSTRPCVAYIGASCGKRGGRARYQ